jgi:hypothetical protein
MITRAESIPELIEECAEKATLNSNRTHEACHANWISGSLEAELFDFDSQDRCGRRQTQSA